MADASDIDASPTSDAAAAPYPGLRSFAADEADRFFGRDELTDLIMKRFWTVLDEPGSPAWVWVTGPSGVGKTSLLHAGFAAHLRSLGYRYVSLVPGSAPLQALADALAGYLDVTPEEAEAGLRDDAARWFAGQRRDRDAGELVLIVDQFEDALRLGDRAERRLFLDALDALAAPGAADRCVVLAGLRTEHFAEVAARPAWAGSLQDAQVLVPRLEGHQLNQAVAEPARAAVVVVDDALVTAVLDDAAAYAGEAPLLPLVAHAMRRVWEEGDGRGMTAAAYRDIGGLSGAVAASAEGVCESLGLDGDEPARRAFNALVRRDDDGRLTLLALPYQQLVAIVGAEPADQFVAAGLLTHREGQVTLTHEALVAAWPRLQGWVDAAAASPNGAHTEGPAPADRPVETSARVPGRRWLRPVGALAVALLAVGLVATGVGWNSAEAARDDAQVERDGALSSLVARDAHALGALDPAVAGQLAVAGLAVADTHEARSAVLDVAGGPLAARYVLDGDGAAVEGVAPGVAASSGDGELLAMSVPSENDVRLYTSEGDGLVPAGQVDLAFEHIDAGGRLEHVALSPDGAVLAAVVQMGDDLAEGASDGSLVLLWDVAGQHPTELGGMAYGSADDDADGGEVVQGAAFSADGGELAVVTHRVGDGADGGGALDLWDLSDASSPDRADRAETGGPLWDVAYHPDTARVAVAVDAGGVQVWDAGGELDQRAQHLPGDEPARSVAFHPEGEHLAAGGDDGTLWLWDVTDPSSPDRRDVDDAGFDGAVAVVAFSPDGAQLVAGGDDATVRVWPGEGGGPLMDLPHPAPVVGAGFAGDGSLVAAEGTGTLRQWDLLPAVPLQVGDAVTGVTFDDEGLMAAFSTGGARFWSGTDATGDDDTVGSYRGGGPAGTVPYDQAGLDGELSGAADLSPDGSRLAVASGPGQVSLLDVGEDDAAEVATLGAAASDDGGAADDEVVAVAFSPDGDQLALLGSDSGPHLWERGSEDDWSDATEVDVDGDAGVNIGPGGPSDSRGWRDLAWAGDGTVLGALDQDGVVILYDVAAASTAVVDDVWREIDGYRSLALNGDGSALAVGGAEGTVVVAGPDSAAVSSPVVFEMVASGAGTQSGEVAALAFHPERNLLAAGAGDAGVWLWDLDAVDDDTEGPVSANDDALEAVVAAEEGTVPEVAFDPTGRVLVAGVADGHVRMWPTEVDAAVAQLCDRAGDGLTAADLPFDSPTLLDRYDEACD